MRLFERINRRGAVLHPLATPRKPLALGDVRKAVRPSVRVVADDCAAWCADDPGQWRATANHNPGELLGPLRLPFDSMRFEWVFPPSPRTDGTQFAAWITADDPQEYENAPAGTAQLLAVILFTARGSILHYSPIVIGMPIDADGNCLGFDSNRSLNSDFGIRARRIDTGTGSYWVHELPQY